MFVRMHMCREMCAIQVSSKSHERVSEKGKACIYVSTSARMPFFLQVKQFVRMSLRRSGLDGHCKTLCLTNRTTDTGCVGKLSGGG